MKAGSLHPDGIPIHPEEELSELIREHGVDEVVFAYSDVHEDYVAARRAIVEAAGASFSTFDVDATMIRSSKPVIAVTHSRRSGAAQRLCNTSRRI